MAKRDLGQEFTNNLLRRGLESGQLTSGIDQEIDAGAQGVRRSDSLILVADAHPRHALVRLFLNLP